MRSILPLIDGAKYWACIRDVGSGSFEHVVVKPYLAFYTKYDQRENGYCYLSLERHTQIQLVLPPSNQQDPDWVQSHLSLTIDESWRQYRHHKAHDLSFQLDEWVRELKELLELAAPEPGAW